MMIYILSIINDINNIDFSNIIEFVKDISLIIGAVVSVIISFQSVIETYSIEVAFMTKKEQTKYNFTKTIILFGLLFLLNLMHGVNGLTDEKFDTITVIEFILMLGTLFCCIFWGIIRRDNTKYQVSLFLSIMLFSCMLIYSFGYISKDAEQAYGVIFVLSILVAWIVNGLIFFMMDIRKTGIARVFYYDKEMNKKVYIFMRYDEKHCLGGDACNISECKEFYFRLFEEVKKHKICPVSGNADEKNILTPDKTNKEEYRMAITNKEILHHWNYFCSLCKRLDDTRQYIDHSAENNILKNNSVNSFEFQQLIILAAVEFENISKQICLDIDSSFNIKNANIKQITIKILNKYPNIGKTEIMSDFQNLQPLKEWGTYTDQTDNNKTKVKGIDWWNNYSDIKHRTFMNYNLATLENAVNAISSLMVLELYLMKIKLGSVKMSLEKPCKYFNSIYTSDILCTNEKALPDFDGEDKKGLVNGEMRLETISRV